MRCDFCEASLPDTDPQNLALLRHITQRQECNEQFGYLIENLDASWTKAMSGG